MMRLMVLNFIVLSALQAQARPMIFCDQQVEIAPLAEGDEALAERMAEGLCWNLGRFQKLFGRRLPGTLRVSIALDMEDFQRRSGRSWSIAAVWTEGGILTQPVRSLRRVDDLPKNLTHELVHGFVRQACGRACPRWLEEGLAVELAGQRPDAQAPTNEAALAALEKRLLDGGGSRAQIQADYGACRALVRKIIKAVGVRTLLDALPRLKNGPDLLDRKLGGSTLGGILFPKKR